MQALGSYQGGQAAVPRPRHRPGHDADRRRRRGADGARRTCRTSKAHLRGLRRRARRSSALGKKKWRKHVVDVVERLSAALVPDDVVLGGGNVRQLEEAAAGLPRRRQRERVRRRLPAVGAARASDATPPRAAKTAPPRQRDREAHGEAARTHEPAGDQRMPRSPDGAAWRALDSASRAKLRAAAPAPAVRRRPGRGERLAARGGRPLPRLLEEPHHRRDAAAAAAAGRGVRPARAHRRDVPRREDQRHREPRRAARRAARAARRVDRRRRRERRARGARGARPHGRLRRPRAQRRVEGPHRQAHPQRRQHRHRRLGPRPGDGLRGAAPLQRRAT